ncbi:MAG: hypothetical protein K1000chlam2_00258 [Chlamydiae bacterium]|nr:hypothetical protein [Chlamydiota bacterium]
MIVNSTSSPNNPQWCENCEKPHIYKNTPLTYHGSNLNRNMSTMDKYSTIMVHCPLTIHETGIPHHFNRFHNIDKLEPYKLLQYARTLTPPNVDLSTIKGRITLAEYDAKLSILKQTLFSELTFNKLSDYHVVKLICLFPDQLESKKDTFINALQAFKKDLHDSLDDEKMLKRASKISKALLEHDPLSAFAPMLDPLMTIKSSEGSEFTLNRFTWAVSLRAWRSMLTQKFEQKNLVGISKEGLEFIGQTFAQRALPPLSYDSLLQAYDEADHLDYREMKFACTKGLIHEMNEEKLMDLLEFANKYNDDVLFDACLGFLCKLEENKIEIKKDDGKYILKISELSERSANFLKKVSKIFSTVNFIQSSVNRILLNTHKDLIFSNATYVTCDCNRCSSPKFFQSLGTHCPNARKCTIENNKTFNIKNTNVTQWGNVEILHLLFPKPILSEFHLKNFPKLKFCCFDTSESADVTEENGILYIPSKFKSGPEYYSFAPFKHLITDEIVLEISRSYFGGQMDFSECTLSQTTIEKLCNHHKFLLPSLKRPLEAIQHEDSNPKKLKINNNNS